MDLRTPAIICSLRPHGETAAVVRMMTPRHGMVAAYVAGARGRLLRPVLIPGNRVDAQLHSKSDTQLPFARLELVQSRGPWLTEPLPAAGIIWATTLAASTLPERQCHGDIHDALDGLLEAICVAPSARRWIMPLLSFEALLLRELGYGEPVARPEAADPADQMRAFDQLGRHVERYLLADRRGDVMAARTRLRARLAKIVEK